MEVEQEEVHKESKKTAEAREIEQRKKKVEIAKVKVQLNIVKSDMDEAVQNQDFAKAQELKASEKGQKGYQQLVSYDYDRSVNDDHARLYRIFLWKKRGREKLLLLGSFHGLGFCPAYFNGCTT